jgi:16S rRNA C967 or C1407 C5-methylase (RsmB/RsmF family)
MIVPRPARFHHPFRLPSVPNDLAAAQRALLEKAAALLKPAGRICYSTRSIQKTENQAVIQDFLKTHDQFQLAQEHLTLPSDQPFDHDTAYTVLLMRRP